MVGWYNDNSLSAGATASLQLVLRHSAPRFRGNFTGLRVRCRVVTVATPARVAAPAPAPPPPLHSLTAALAPLMSGGGGLLVVVVVVCWWWWCLERWCRLLCLLSSHLECFVPAPGLHRISSTASQRSGGTARGHLPPPGQVARPAACTGRPGPACTGQGSRHRKKLGFQ